MANTKRKHSWEEDAPVPRPWDFDPVEVGLEAWNHDSDTDESEDDTDPSAELFAYVTFQHQAGLLTAKQACVIGWWASKAGVASVEQIALPPDTIGTGDFKRLIDKVLRGSTLIYILPMPASCRAGCTPECAFELIS